MTVQERLIRKVPKALAAKLLAFLESELTGQMIFDIKIGQIRSGKLTEAIRPEDSFDGEAET